MGIFDSAKDKLSQWAEDNPDKVEQFSDQAIERAGDHVDSVTDGKYADHVDTAQGKADDAIGHG